VEGRGGVTGGSCVDVAIVEYDVVEKTVEVEWWREIRRNSTGKGEI